MLTAIEINTIVIAADDVSGTTRRAAEDVVVRPKARHHTRSIKPIPESYVARCVEADVVARDNVSGCTAIINMHPIGAVAAYDVSRSGGRAADGIVRRAVADDDAAAAIRNGRVAIHVGADVVALDDVARRAA